MNATMTVPSLDVSGTRPIPFGRLVAVELRKIRDTRAGKWLIFAILGLSGAAAAAVLFTDGNKAFRDFFGATAGAAGFLLPVLGILLVTSEWGQRTASTTFAHTPARARVMVAKLVSAMLAGLAAVAIIGVVSAIGTTLAGHANGLATLDLGYVAKQALSLELGIVSGVAFGLFLLSTAPALVLNYIVPTVLGLAISLVSALKDLGPWISMNDALSNILSTNTPSTSSDWLHLGVASVIWIVVPMAIGFVRVHRAEIK